MLYFVCQIDSALSPLSSQGCKHPFKILMEATDTFTRGGKTSTHIRILHTISGRSRELLKLPMDTQLGMPLLHKGTFGSLVMFFFNQGASYKDIFIQCVKIHWPLHYVLIKYALLSLYNTCIYILKNKQACSIFPSWVISHCHCSNNGLIWWGSPAYPIPLLSPKIQSLIFHAFLDLSS